MASRATPAHVLLARRARAGRSGHYVQGIEVEREQPGQSAQPEQRSVLVLAGGLAAVPFATASGTAPCRPGARGATGPARFRRQERLEQAMTERATRALPSQALLRAVIEAFGASRDGPPRVACVLRGRTARRGLAGRCRPRHWCCPLTALVRFLLEDGMVELGPLPLEIPARMALFVALATEMIRWDVQSQSTRLPPQAHLRARAVDFTVRLGALLGLFAPGLVDSPLLADHPAWADPRRRSEPLYRLYEAAGVRTSRELADKRLGYHEQTISRWHAHRARPCKKSIQELAQALAPG